MITQAEVRDGTMELAGLMAALREVHRRLLAHLQVGYERLFGRLQGMGGVLQLAVHDPLFAWVSPLTGLMAEIDHSPSSALGPEPVVRARGRVAALLNEPSEFRDGYLACLQADPALAMAHAELRGHLMPTGPSGLPPRAGPVGGCPGSE